ncbi:hypothetical protein [Pseudonocardia kunmingensis]|uniref:Uncharacterized protein n=1 Tax=Pseudonocardia kunmingensis TaxID=630975 RepID=A0A543CYB6_9PSEU|nr:hypothetical protein [Pseudonocardia kunmingensis]TQM02093.1 hypothetical protein FB558_7954 [Pseudonocardia kunmingensis]
MTSRQPADRPERVLADLLGLLAVADQALLLEGCAEAVLQDSGEQGTGEPAPDGVRIAGEYRRLWRWSLDFAPYAGEGSLERQVSDVVLGHHRLLRATARVPVPCHPAIGELRRKTAALRSVRDELDLWINTLTPAAGPPPG